MPNLQGLRRRIRSVQNTQKITRAMQMVSGAKLRRMQSELASFRPYAERLETATQHFLAAHPDLEHPLLDNPVMTITSDRVTPPGLVIVTSDTGLCGSYNDRILEGVDRFLMENPSAKVVAIGKKGNRFLARKRVARIQEILDWGGRFDSDKSAQLVRWLVQLYEKQEVNSWWVASTRFLSALRFQPTVEQFLPLERPASAGLPERQITEPDLERATHVLLSRSIEARFARILLEAFTSEHSARMIAMKNATDNAAEMIDHLTLIRNKARQAAITKELIEVVSGSEALR